MREWEVRVRGGSFDGLEATSVEVPGVILVLWRCLGLGLTCEGGVGCRGHGTFHPEHPGIVLKHAVAYRRVELREDERLAVYELDAETRGPEVYDFADAATFATALARFHADHERFARSWRRYTTPGS